MTTLNTIIDQINTSNFTVQDDTTSTIESYLVTNNTTGITARIQDTEGEPESLNISIEGDETSWEALAADPAAATAQIEALTA